METDFDRVAADPRGGDVLNFPGGRLSYEVKRVGLLEDGGILVGAGRADAVSAERACRGEGSRTVIIGLPTWTDLVSFACSVVRGTGPGADAKPMILDGRVAVDVRTDTPGLAK